MSTRSLASDDESGAFARSTALPGHAEQFTMREAARSKGVSYHTVSRAVRTGKLPSRRTGRMVLISAADLAGWHPMRERAPLQYRHRSPEPDTTPGVIDLATGERFELARRLSILYEAIQASALHDSTDEFIKMIAERFAAAMDFDRVAVWCVRVDRSEITLLSTHGNWFAPGSEPTDRPSRPFDPVSMYLSRADVYDGIRCWISEPPPVRMDRVFSASMVANGLHIGYILGDRDGRDFSLTPSQIELGDNLANHFATVLALRRSYDHEVVRREQERSVANDHAGVLSEIARAFNEGVSLTIFVRKVIREASRLTGSHCGGVMLQQSGESLLCHWTVDGEDLPIQDLPIQLTSVPSTMRAFELARPLQVHWSDATDRERMIWEQTGSHSNLIFPLAVNGALAGVMMLRFREEQKVLTEGQFSVCETLASACVAAITRDRLLESLKANEANGHHADARNVS